MSAVLGGDSDEVVAAIEAAGLTAANRNGPGQVVAAGARDALAKFADEPPPGVRVRPLAVAGAFHTHFMGPAEEALAAYIGSLQPRDPTQLLLSNADGLAVTTGAEVLDRLARQVTRPVRWDLSQRTLHDVGVTAAIELPPAGTLVGLAKRALPGVELLAVKTPDDLAAARQLIGSRPQHGQGEHIPDFHVVATPVKGIFTRADALAEGDTIPPAGRIGTVRTNRAEHSILAPAAGGPFELVEWVRHDGDIVAAGLPVARLHRSEA
jgi:[acyl-carrier-protein] S-malonyltransferase